MNMSYQEKSIWISLFTTILIFSYYFTNAFSALNNIDSNKTKIIGLFIGVVALVVIVEIVLHIALSFAYRKDTDKGKDERDKWIELKATRNAHFLLIVGVWITGVSMLMTESSLVLANIIMFFFILSEILGFATHLLYYRRGV